MCFEFEFDDVMGVIINAPSPLNIEFAIPGSAAAEDVAAEGGEEEAPATPSYDVGQTELQLQYSNLKATNLT